MLHVDLIAPVSTLLERHATQRPDKVAYWDSSRSVTYADLARRTASIAANLTRAGLRDGDRIAIYLPNGVDWIEACFAALRAGAVVVPISYDAAEGEISYRLTDAACGYVLTTATRKDLIDKVCRDAAIAPISIFAGPDTERAGVSLEALASTGPASPSDPDDIDRSSFIIYTSGTTGRAKGVLLSLRGMLWIAASCWAPIAELSEKDIVLSPLPLFHSYGLNLSVLGVLAVGASQRIMEKFSPQQALDLLRTGTYSVLPGVPTMFHYLLLRAQESGVERLGGLRLCISAGAIMPATLNRAFEERFSIRLLDGYGITETSTMVTMNWLHGARPMGSCGLPVPGLAVRIVDPSSAEDVPIGEEGELIVRGPNLMQGYHNKPAETASALRKGWYHTGDLAKSDPAGYLTITGRIKELIIRGGQNIAPAEIEEVVVRHPQVRDCAVVGLKHATLGEVPCLFVVAKENGLDVASLMDHCRAQLSAYKIPEATHLVGEIPRTGSGKIMRFKLVEMLSQAS
ncbi:MULTISPECIES: class I adenylate-forming enzyme family protein [Bradyrhizobium]|uniref:3-methylmercaptopropionyl-CoA ligase n=1 Tax=Bradyrhizobium elkanii TaxID=29448 RepID=A0A4V6CXG6_BRAEL|nr:MULTISPECIES: class I adenylate-forming enzyme family protein [Bradyrhizobium]MTV14064.1 long-chain fatty acid--CoA ligase [Bradyrhizobium sp. BR2003]TKV80375.1 acyl--CoA ligase [Bradyrhizobium elkanii]